ncbi:MAG: hypothetical protein RLZZ609_3036 [Cyanobacteriota bacterium]|jgi:hypothetical protein
MIRFVSSWLLALRPLHASLLLLVCAIGAMGLVGLVVVTMLPLVVLFGGLAVWIVAILLIGWSAIEALAACERWMEREPRFQR